MTAPASPGSTPAAAPGRPRPGPASRLELFGWAMFDFANSSYTTVIITVVYAVVFPRFIVGDAPEYRRGNLLWSLALTLSYALVVLTAPILGAIMDHSAAKKRFLFGSYLLTVGATAALYFATADHLVLAVALVALSNYGFAVGEAFSSSFLPELARPESLGKVSGLAWGLGYLGGLLATIVVTGVVGELSLENAERARWVGPLTAAFFFVAALPTFLLLKERARPRALPPGSSRVRLGFSRLVRTARTVRDFRDLLVFFVAFFFAMAGLSIVISFAFIYGDQVVGWSRGTQTLMFVLTQLCAASGTLLFGWLQQRWGDKRTFNLTLLVWTVTVALIYWTPAFAGALAVTPERFFLVVGGCAGLCLGATQSASRTIVALFSPPGRSAEFFGFWGVFSRLASIFGLVSLGLLQSALGLRHAILVCALFFLLAFVFALFVNEARGRAAALAHAEEPSSL